MKWFLAFCAVAVWAAAGITQAEAQSRKTRIEVIHSGDDSVGRQLATAVREQIAKSARFELVMDGSGVIDISMISMDMDKTESGAARGNRSAVSVLFELWLTRDDHKDLYVTNVLHIVGASRVEEVGRDVMANLDAWMQGLAKK